MTQLERAEAIFVALAELPGAERTALLEERCGVDHALRAEVESLLAHHDGTMVRPGFLDPAEVRKLAAPPGAGVSAGDRLGAYTVLSLLGSGGMADVYMARQQRPQRTVALKIVRRAMSASLVRRFEREAEVLGRLHHPGIAQVYEAGAAEMEAGAGRGGGRGGAVPYIAMELVAGPPITSYAERRGLGVRERAELVARVCDAVEHAHHRGVIHRDLKPGNVLVDEHGQPKVLDFGVALALDTEREVTRHTLDGQLVGTLPYMSPEQVGGDRDAIDTRSDVYALGVMLYELLTGTLPHELGGASIPEAVRIIREEAPRRLTAHDRSLGGDLDTIVATALEKDAGRRYQSPAMLAEDLRRFLGGQPIAARNASALELVTRRLRRYRGIAAAAALALVLTAALAGWAWRASVRSGRLARDLSAQLSASNIERGRLFGREGNLAGAEAVLWREHLGAPESAAARWALWELYSRHPQLAAIPAHTEGVRGAAWSPAGDRLFTAGALGRIAEWEMGSLREARAFRADVGELRQIAVSADGRELAAVGAAGLMVWDLASGAVVSRGMGREGLRAAAFDPRGGALLVGAEDGSLRAWDVKGAREVERRREHAGAVLRVRFSPDGARLATVSADGTARLWDGRTLAPAAVFSHVVGVEAAAFGDGGRLLALAGRDPLIYVRDLGTGEDLKLEAPNGAVGYLGFLPDGRMISTGWWSVDVWDLAAGTRRSVGSVGSWAALDPSADGNLLAVGDTDGTVRLIELSSPGIRVLGGQAGRVAAAVSADGMLVASGDEEGAVWVRRREDGAMERELTRHGGRVRTVSFSPAGGRVLAASDDGVARITEMATGGTIELRPLTVVSARSAAWSPDGTRVLVVNGANELEVFDAVSGASVARRPCSAFEIVSVAFGPDGRTLAGMARDKTLYLWRGGEGPLARVPTDPVMGWTVSFSGNGGSLVLGDWGRQVNIVDVGRGAIVRRMLEHNALVSDVAWRPGSAAFAASASRDGLVLLWDLEDGIPVARVDVFDDAETFTLSFSGDGRHLAVGASGGRVGLVDLEHYHRHIAGNSAYQRARLGPGLGAAVTGSRARTAAGSR